jgi:hypothetical protein
VISGEKHKFLLHFSEISSIKNDRFLPFGVISTKEMWHYWRRDVLLDDSVYRLTSVQARRQGSARLPQSVVVHQADNAAC